MQELTGFNESSLAQTQFEGQAEATQLFGSVVLFGSVWVSVLTDREHFLDSMDSGAWPLLVGGVILKLIFALKCICIGKMLGPQQITLCCWQSA